MNRRETYAWLLPAVRRGDTVICASRRLARELGRAFDARMLAAGQRAWSTPPVHFWQDWLAARLSAAATPSLPEVIDPASATILWERALDRSGRDAVLGLAGVVRHAQAAWSRLQEWQVPPEAVAAAAASRDEHWFVRAADAFARRLADDGWIDSSQLAACCAANAGDPGFHWPGRIVYAGFDRLGPSLVALFAALEARGVAVEPAPDPGAGAAEPAAVHFRDPDSQWRAAGRWARRCLEQEPAARIAIVVPDLERDAARVARLVRDGFAPGWQAGGDDYRRSVNLSYGQRLAAYPAIAVALLWLDFAASGLRGPAVGTLLRSGFGPAADPGGRARLELALRRLPDRNWTPPDLLAAIEPPDDDDTAQDWRGRLSALVALHDRRDERAGAAAFAERFDACLAALGWPGGSPLASDEFQLMNRWRQLLNQLAGLERVAPAITLAEATRRLRQIAGEVLFQPEADDGALDVIGLLETAGHEFDALWVGGMDAGRWPPAGNPLALVNRRLQRDAGMPDATPADTLAFARRTLERLFRSSASLHVAWARAEGDSVLVPSPLLGDVSAAREGDADDPGWYAATRLGTGRRRRVADDPAPAVRRDEKIRGGAYTVQRMREEPFSAFVLGRLAADTIEPFAAGLTARQRGILVHDALHALLRDRPTQADIRGWSDIDARCEQAVFEAQRRLAAVADPVLARVLRLERNRLEQLLATFLEREREREPFTIEALEAPAKLVRGPVHLSLRIDRVDRLADGSLLLADYKTGAAKRFLGRDREPKTVQMSVYACAVEESVGALAFCNLDSRDVAWDGAGAGLASGRVRIDPEDWPAALARWRAEVEGLLLRFSDGDIGVNVLQAVDSARPHALLSRIAEIRRDG